MLFLNPLLPFLARCVALGLFRDYNTIEDVLNIPAPPEGEQAIVLKWSNPNAPLFSDQEGKMEKVFSFAQGLRDLGIRAGYKDPPRPHQIRAGNLSSVSKSLPSRWDNLRSQGNHR